MADPHPLPLAAAVCLIPVESIIRDRQADCSAALSQADRAADATIFIEFMITAISRAMDEISLSTDYVTDQETDHVTDQVARLLSKLISVPQAPQRLCNPSDCLIVRPFVKNYLHPALDAGLIKMTRPDTPRARNQKYKLSVLGPQR